MERTPSLTQLARVFGRIGLLSFGGPVAQIGLLHHDLVERHRWLDEATYLKALSFCMMLPGPEAMQLCTYAGWRLRGVAGGLIAGALFVLPGAAVMAVLAWAYLQWGALPAIQAAFLGVKAVVIVVVFQALAKLAARTLTSPLSQTLALASFLALVLFDLPFPLIVLIAALIGLLRPASPGGARHPAPPVSLRPSLRRAALWATIWLAPILGLALGGAERLAQIGTFFSKLAVVSFGGAYAALAYTAQEAVAAQGWLSAEQMLDGLGLAETTPGPLILVTEFVGYLAGHSAGGTGLALAGAGVTLWAIFMPCFLWIFTFAPHVERITAAPRLSGALSTVSAAVVGVIAKLALFLTIGTLFAAQSPAGWPVFHTLSLPAAVLTGLAALCLVILRLPLILTLPLIGAAGWLAGSFA